MITDGLTTRTIGRLTGWFVAVLALLALSLRWCVQYDPARGDARSVVPEVWRGWEAAAPSRFDGDHPAGAIVAIAIPFGTVALVVLALLGLAWVLPRIAWAQAGLALVLLAISFFVHTGDPISFVADDASRAHEISAQEGMAVWRTCLLLLVVAGVAAAIGGPADVSEQRTDAPWRFR